MEKVTRLRPYSPRLDGVSGNSANAPNPGGIFGQRICPAHRGRIFEAHYALPGYVEEAELQGGTLYPDKLTADVTTADPVERKIRVPDLGPEAGSWRVPWPKAKTGASIPSKKRLSRPVPRRIVKRKPALGADPVSAPQASAPVAAPPQPAASSQPAAPQRSGLLGACVIVALGVLTAKVIFS